MNAAQPQSAAVGSHRGGRPSAKYYRKAAEGDLRETIGDATEAIAQNEGPTDGRMPAPRCSPARGQARGSGEFYEPLLRIEKGRNERVEYIRPMSIVKGRSP